MCSALQSRHLDDGPSLPIFLRPLAATVARYEPVDDELISRCDQRAVVISGGQVGRRADSDQ